jgi:hypothetical protein
MEQCESLNLPLTGQHAMLDFPENELPDGTAIAIEILRCNYIQS